jgi:hypothetical protein
MQCAENHERLFECGVTDGVKLTMVKDENAVKPKPEEEKKVVAVVAPVGTVAEQAFELLKAKTILFNTSNESSPPHCVDFMGNDGVDPLERDKKMIEQLEISKERLVKFFEDLNWSEDDLKLPWEKKRHMVSGLGNPF